MNNERQRQNDKEDTINILGWKYWGIKLHNQSTLIYLRARLKDSRVKKEEPSAQAARAGHRLKCCARSFQLSSLGWGFLFFYPRILESSSWINQCGAYGYTQCNTIESVLTYLNIWTCLNMSKLSMSEHF